MVKSVICQDDRAAQNNERHLFLLIGLFETMFPNVGIIPSLLLWQVTLYESITELTMAKYLLIYLAWREREDRKGRSNEFLIDFEWIQLMQKMSEHDVLHGGPILFPFSTHGCRISSVPGWSDEFKQEECHVKRINSFHSNLTFCCYYFSFYYYCWDAFFYCLWFCRWSNGGEEVRGRIQPGAERRAVQQELGMGEICV